MDGADRTADRDAVQQVVKRYYGETLGSSADLKTSACCDASAPPPRLRALLADIHPDVAARYYGCGLVAPDALTGAHVLDLGCGTGRDAYLLARLVGETGSVTGVDMTEAQLAVARRAEAWAAERAGYAAPNTHFLLGDIERLDALDLAPASFDVIVSNCVINLAANKAAVLAGAHRLLKTGGELYFSDVYADRRISAELRADPVLYGECLSGALYSRDFLRLAREAGFAAPRRISTRPLEVRDPTLVERLGDLRFVSEVWRLFKIDDADGSEEDFGQSARYRGGLEDAAAACVLDEAHVFPTGETVPVSADTARMITQSRFAPFFEVTASDGVHRGAFAVDNAHGAPTPVPAAGACC